MFGWFINLLADWSVAWLVGWLVGWMAGWFVSQILQSSIDYHVLATTCPNCMQDTAKMQRFSTSDHVSFVNDDT